MHKGIDNSAGNQWPDGDALKEKDAEHRTDDQCRYDFWCAFKQLYAIAASRGSYDAGNDSCDAKRGFKGVQHDLDGDFTRCDRHQNRYRQ